jgi:hypothetical protein
MPFYLLNFSMFVTVCYLNTAEIIILEWKEGERAEELVPLLLLNPHCPQRYAPLLDRTTHKGVYS